jgi:sugar lactone lactonase YvrE
MQAILNRLTSPVRSLAITTSVILFSVLSLCLVATPAMAAGPQAPPIVVTGPTTQIGSIHFGGATGGWISGQSPLGGTVAVGPNGDVIYGDGYGGCTACGVFLSTPSGTQSLLAPFGNSNAAGVDQYGNAYIARDYGVSIIKLPYNAATSTYTGFTTLPTANCLGGTQDTVACVFAPGTQATLNAGATAGAGNPGFTSLFFDNKGNFFFATDTNPGTGGDKNTIYECSAQCQAETDGNGTYPPVVIFADTKDIGAVSIDPWGNLFFADGADNGADTGKVSYLEELPFNGTTYASSPTVMTSYTTSAGYNAICGVAAGNYGTVYFSTANDGVFALPNNSSGPTPAEIYQVNNQGGGKGLGVDARGDLYQVGYSNTLSNDAVFYTQVNNLQLGSTTVGGTATTATGTVYDSAGNCTTAPTLTFAGIEGGVSKTEFTAAAGSSCSGIVGTGNGTFSPALASTGASFPVTITFSPTKVGDRTATLATTDATNSASGSAAVSGLGQGAAVNLDPGVITAYTTGFSSPQSISVDAAGNVAVADTVANKIFSIPSGITTPVSIGTGFDGPEATAFDAAGNLYIADSGNNQIVWIPNVSGALVPASQVTLIPDTAFIAGSALNKPTGLAVGPDGTLYISDFGNDRVLTYSNGFASVFAAGLNHPWGVAVDAANNVYVANTGGGNVMVYPADAGFSSLSVTGVTEPWGIVVDASGSLLISDKLTGNIVHVPNLAGTLTPASALVVETNPTSAYGIALDGSGNLYTSDATSKAVYAIQRTAAALNLGTVSDGLTNSGQVILSVTGTAAATLATPDVTEPTNTMFTVVPSTSNGCTAGSSGNPGQACQFTATFAPPPATANGAQSGTATIDITTPAVSPTVALSGTATVSSILPQTITGFNPPTTLQAGQQTTLAVTGGASGNPVVFTIDATSACPACATITGTTLTAVSAGSIKVDANQAGGTASGSQYAAATQVQKTITINNSLVASDVPALLMNEIYWSYQSGSFTDGQNPAGGSFAVTPNGIIAIGTSYSNKADFVSVSTGALLNQVTINGPGGFALDSKNNLYMSHLYGTPVLKIPLVNGVYATLSDSTPPNCTGTDTVLCTSGSAPSGGVKAIAFDPSGNLYMVAVPGSTGNSAIYECNATCQTTGGTATTVYTDANAISQIAFDPWGNLFFTEGDFANATNFGNDEASTSNLYELPYTAGTGFAATPTLLQTLTDATPASYDNQLDGVAVASNGTIYYADQNDGTFAIPNTKTGGPDLAHQYVVSALGAKAMQLDAQGNEWVVVYHAGGDNLGEALLGDLTTPIAQLNGAPVTAPATVVDNAFGCGTTAALAIASNNPEFSANATTTCSGVSASFTTAISGSTYPATITFQATSGGPQTANLSISDTANGGQGTATVNGVGQETAQTIAFTAPTVTTYTYAPGLTVTLGASLGGSNNPVTFTVDATSTGAGTISGKTLTVTQAGSIVVDANELGGLVGGVFYEPATQVQLTLTINQAGQAIIFAPPTSPITYAPGLTDALNASGGGSGNAVTFTVDASSTGAGTISGSTLTVTQAGNIVVDANQAASVDYLAAPQVQQTIVVNQAGQTITFTPLSQPFYYIAAGASLGISATGGGSDSAIVFTVDAKSTMKGSFSVSKVSGAVSTATLTMPANQSPTSGTIIVDANQPGNTNYAASSQTQFTINVGAPLTTQSITFAQPQTQVGGTTLALTATASSGFPVVFTSSTTSVCTVSASTATFVKVTSASACTITASQPGDNQYFAAANPVTVTFAVNPAGQTPSMTVNLSLPSLTIEPGTVGLTQITLNSVNNFAGTVTFTVSGLPTGYSYTFSPNPVSFAPSPTTGLPQASSATTTLTITPPATAVLVRHDFRPLFPATFAVALCFLGLRKRNRLQLLLLLVVVFAGLGMISGCGGSSSSSSTSQPVTTNVTVTATAGSVTSSAPLTVIVE